MSPFEERVGVLPDWLIAWLDNGLSTTDALTRFDSLGTSQPDALTSNWRGRTLPTGHPLDGVLEALGWYGKSVVSPEHAHPLLFRLRSGAVVPLEPALMPAEVALRWPAFSGSAPVRAAFTLFGPMLRTRSPGARLALHEFRGKLGTALVYKRQPITDHLRHIDADHVIGLMERRGMDQPFFFLLSREPGGLHAPSRLPD